MRKTADTRKGSKDDKKGSTAVTPLKRALTVEQGLAAVDTSSPLCVTLTDSRGSKHVMLTHRALLNNPEHADVSFVFTVNKKTETIVAHSFILQGRQCSLLLQQGPLISKVDKKAGSFSCHISDNGLLFCNVQILNSLLVWVYTGETNTIESSDDMISLVNLLATTRAVGLEGSLLDYVIETRLQKITTLANVHLMLAKAAELKMERLLNHCKFFAFQNWQEFISDKSGCRRFDVSLLADLNSKQLQGNFPSPPERPKPDDPIRMHYDGMVNVEPDMAIAPAGGGDPVGCHRAILAGFSDSLKQLLLQQSILSPTGAGRRKTSSKLPEIGLASQNGTHMLHSSAATKAFVHFIYSGSVEFVPLVACELINALCDYQFPSLEAACESRIVDGVDAFTAFPILAITFLWVTRQSMGPLRNSCTDYIVQNYPSIDLNALKGLPPEIFHVMQALQRAQVKGSIAFTTEGPSSRTEPSPAPSAVPQTTASSGASLSSVGGHTEAADSAEPSDEEE